MPDWKDTFDAEEGEEESNVCTEIFRINCPFGRMEIKQCGNSYSKQCPAETVSW